MNFGSSTSFHLPVGKYFMKACRPTSLSFLIQPANCAKECTRRRTVFEDTSERFKASASMAIRLSLIPKADDSLFLR